MKKIAEENYGETDEIRQQAIKSMREWVANNPEIFKFRLDSKNCLKYLRARKFSLVKTQEVIKRAHDSLLKEKNGVQVFRNLDFKLPVTQELLNSG